MSAAIIPKGGVLSADEGARLAQLEREIKTGISTFIKVGRALAEIRDARLYRATHGSFESYCRETWGFSRQRASQLIGAAGVAVDLSTAVDTPERVLRPLVALEPAARRETWAKAKKAAGDEPIASKHVKAAMPTTRTNSVLEIPKLTAPMGIGMRKLPAEYLGVAMALQEVELASRHLVADLINENKPLFQTLCHNEVFVRLVVAFKALDAARDELGPFTGKVVP